MIGKKINQLATELAPDSTDLTIIGDPISGVSKKITLAQLGAIFSGAVSFYTNLAAFPVTGDINVIYCAKDTQKLYLWSGSAYVEVFPSQALLNTYQLRSEKGNANGYASLDSLGKVPISQLPSSIMEYKGTWNAATNTPTLANGTGDTGDVYICNVAGTVNFGAGPLTFAVGDYVIYSGTIWQRSSGAVGTVTSVAASITGNSVSISGSPIVTSGTLAFSFAGNATQYVRGDGQLATLPTNGGGGGASVSYYLNGSINQGTIGGVTYYEMNKTPIIGAGTDFTRNSNGYIASFLTDANDPALLNIPAGNFNFETYFEASSGGGSPTFYIELYKYDGTTFTLIASNSTSPKLINDATNIEAYFSALAVPQTTLTLTDRLAIRIYVTTAGRTITLHTENGHLCQVITTFTTGLTALNGLTAQVQYLATGTSGTDFNIASASATHTFNLPTASATNRGALSSADWTTFNNKQPQLNGTGFIKANGTTISYDNSTYLTTSAASSLYLPLTGGTMTGAIIGTTSTFANAGSGIGVEITNSSTGDGLKINHSSGRALNIASSASGFGIIINNSTASTSAPFTIQKQGSNVITFSDNGAANFSGQLTLGSTITNGTNTYTLPSATGTLALTSALSGYLPLTGGTLTGALSGTSAIFSGKVGIGATPYASTTAIIRAVSATSTNYALIIEDNASNQLFEIKNTGAATFSSSVTATSLALNGSIANSGDAATLTIKQSSTSYTNGIYLERGGERNGYHMYIGGALDALTFRRNYFGTQSDVMSLTRDGNVGIGTTLPGLSGSGRTALTLNDSSLSIFELAVGGSLSGYVYTNSSIMTMTASGSRPLTFETGGTERMRITNGGAVQIQQTIQTGAPTNGTAQPWKLGNAVSGTVSPSHYLVVEINGQSYTINAFNGFP
jgi:hypothetical protein